MKILFSFVLVASLFYPLTNNKAEAANTIGDYYGFKYKKGDILITDSTSAKGIVGHTGIYIGNNQVLHTSGWKSEPWPRVMSLKDWVDRYKKRVKVVRYSDSSKAAKAADNAVKYFKGKKIGYRVTENPRDIDPYTYCSEIVWYSYWKAGVTFKYPAANINGWKIPPTIKPYDYTNTTLLKIQPKFKVVDNKF